MHKLKKTPSRVIDYDSTGISALSHDWLIILGRVNHKLLEVTYSSKDDVFFPCDDIARHESPLATRATHPPFISHSGVRAYL